MLRRTQARPANPSRKAKSIQPFRIVAGNPGAQDGRFPRSQRQFAAVQLFQNRLQTFRPLKMVFGINTLPGKKKSVEILGRDRLNFCAKAIDRKPMNSRQQAAIAPFLFGCVWMKFSAKNETFAFESEKSGLNFSRR